MYRLLFTHKMTQSFHWFYCHYYLIEQINSLDRRTFTCLLSYLLKTIKKKFELKTALNTVQTMRWTFKFMEMSMITLCESVIKSGSIRTNTFSWWHHIMIWRLHRSHSLLHLMGSTAGFFFTISRKINK